MNAAVVSGPAFLLPCTARSLRSLGPSSRSRYAYLRFYQSSCCVQRQLQQQQKARKPVQRGYSTRTQRNAAKDDRSHDDVHDQDRSAVALRIQELKAADALHYPRYQPQAQRLPVSVFRTEFDHVTQEGGDDQTGSSSLPRRVELSGRVLSVQRLGAKLIFLKVLDEGAQVQVMCSLRQLVASDGRQGDSSPASVEAFKTAARLLRRGDHVAVTGRATRTGTGELTLAADALPRVQTPALVPLPTRLLDADTRALRRHLDLLVNPDESAAALRLRARLLRRMRTFFDDQRFVEVQTPILAAAAGGAVARPFVTSSGELGSSSLSTSTTPLSLRIAPELWLKRLVVGGLDRVYEIGPSFRNEGIDATHNPEFTTCEFYAAYWTLSRLMAETERLMASLAQEVMPTQSSSSKKEAPQQEDQVPSSVDLCAQGGPFVQLDFIHELQAALGFTLPDLDQPDAYNQLQDLLATHGHSAVLEPVAAHSGGQGSNNTNIDTALSRLLDRLAAAFLEPRSSADRDGPLFITHHPACMSPLAKSFVCPRTGQRVAARAELFVDGRELANMYEEENDPAEQRRKMERQATAARTENGAAVAKDDARVDDNYIAALESGLPPTGGWGCGVERLVMLFSGRPRIADCLSFGTLRHVIAMSREGSH